MLYSDPPCPIALPGTHQFSTAINARYTVGRDHVARALESLLNETTTIAADIETYGVGLAARRIKCVSVGSSTQAVVLDPRDPYQADLVQKVFRDAERIIWHNSPFDVPNLWMNDLITLRDVRKTIDTLIYARLANPGERVRKNLADACDRYLKTGPGGELERAFKALGLNKADGYYNFDLDRPIYLQGAASDPLLTYRLWEVVSQAAYDRLTTGHPFASKSVSGQEARDLVEREQRINREVTLPRSCKGFAIDDEFLDTYTATNAAELTDAETDLEQAGIRPGNGQDLAKVLTDHDAILPDHPRTAKTGQLQMTASLIEKIPHPLARKFVRHKQIQKISKDYIGKVHELADDHGRVHPSFNLLTAATGRIAASGPPTDQFSGPARGIFRADDGDTWTSIDLSQGEPMVIANAAKDVKVLKSYEDGTNDLYTSLGIATRKLPAGTTKAMCEADKAGLGKIRSQLKATLLGILYGEGLAKLSADLGLDPGPYGPPSDWEVQKMGRNPDLPYPKYLEAKKLRQAVFDAMPRTEEFIKTLKSITAKTGKMMTISGRILDIPYSAKHGGYEQHKGVNYFCQGGQYDLLAEALIGIIEAGLQDAIQLTRHDEFVVSTDAATDVRRILETPCERLIMWAGRTPVIRTDMELLGTNWK